MSIAIEAFFSNIRPYVIGAPEPTIRRELVHALQEFCQRTWLWQYDVDGFVLDAGEQEYEIPAPAQTRILGVVSCQYENGAAFTRYRFLPHAFRALDVPQQETPLTICVALKPTDSAVEVGDALFDDYRQAVAYGAIWRVLAIPGKPWSNTEMAALYSGRFETSIRDAVRRRNMNHSGASLHVAHRRYS